MIVIIDTKKTEDMNSFIETRCPGDSCDDQNCGNFCECDNVHGNCNWD